MAKYLDQSGLGTLWKKIKEELQKKQNSGECITKEEFELFQTELGTAIEELITNIQTSLDSKQDKLDFATTEDINNIFK